MAKENHKILIAEAIFVSLRPKQWTKNLILFVALVFSQSLFNYSKVFLSLAAFFLFCLLSGASYIFNDLLDREADKKDQKKSNRPIAAGRLNPRSAFLSAVFLSIVCLIVAIKMSTLFFFACFTYLAIQIFYSLSLKHIVIVDVFCIAFGFVLRLIAGAIVIDVSISSWFIVCTLLISLFLALSKRRSELLISHGHEMARPVLKEYGAEFLDQSISLVASATVVSYVLYTLSSETVVKFNTKDLIYTIPFVLYGVFRYLFLVYKREAGSEPELLLITDKPLLVNILLYGITVFLILY